MSPHKSSSPTPSRDPFPPEKWWSRQDRSREPLWDHSDLSSMFGMAELEIGVADIMNKARADCCLLRDVHFGPEDLSDGDAFRELLTHGWLVESHGLYRLDGQAVTRVHRSFPNV